MKKSVRVLGPATRVLVLVSLLCAIGGESWLLRGGWAYLPHAVALAGLVACAGARLAAAPTLSALLFFTYLAPVVAVVLGRSAYAFLLIWSAALAGVIVVDREGWQWSYPRPWRLALVLWAAVVALAWPITALREADFESLAYLERYNLPNTAIGGSPGFVIAFGMETAIVHLLGLVWLDWLFRHARRLTEEDFQRRIAWPMAGSMLAGSLLALYQGLFDLGFLSTGSWAWLRRASGPLADANAYGAAAAMWTAGLLALVGRSRRQRTVILVGAAVCWAGLWMSGSRTALASACVAFGVVGLSAVTQTVGGLMRRRILAVGAAVAAVFAVTLLVAPVASESPLLRLKRTLPSDLSRASIGAFAREMWNRNGYGEVSTALIVEHPVTGVGIGLFNLSGAALPRASGGPLPPDNAQNWWRHHVAELGFLGAAGLLAWTVVFLVFLVRTSGDPQRPLPAAALKGAMLGFVLASFFGVPAQSLPVTITFWTFVFWYTRLATPPLGPASADDDLPAAQWLIVVAVVGVYAGILLVQARGDARPAMRAALGQWRYAYGVYEAGGAVSDHEIHRLTERHGVAVVSNDTPWMILTIRAEHPDIQQRPVRAKVAVNGRTIVDREMRTNAPFVRVIQTGSAERAILEARVDRTWRPPDLPGDRPDIGLSLSWRFVREPPPGAAITAPLTR